MPRDTVSLDARIVKNSDIPAADQHLLRTDVASLKSMIQDARDYGCGEEDADYMRGLLEAIIEKTLGKNGLK